MWSYLVGDTFPNQGLGLIPTTYRNPTVYGVSNYLGILEAPYILPLWNEVPNDHPLGT